MKQSNKLDFAKNLRILMAEHKTTAKELATYLGVNDFVVFNWRRGNGRPQKYEILVKIADYFGVTIDTLFFGR